MSEVILNIASSLSRQLILVWICVMIIANSNPGVQAMKTPIYIGGFFPLSPNKASVPGDALLAAAKLALQHVNKSDILRDYELQMIVKDSQVSSLLNSKLLYYYCCDIPA